MEWHHWYKDLIPGGHYSVGFYRLSYCSPKILTDTNTGHLLCTNQNNYIIYLFTYNNNIREYYMWVEFDVYNPKVKRIRKWL